MTMTNMKMSKKEATLLAEASPSDQPEYPYGLRISLDSAALDKLGMKKLPEVGAVVEITARAPWCSPSAPMSARMATPRATSACRLPTWM